MTLRPEAPRMARRPEAAEAAPGGSRAAPRRERGG